MLTSVLKAFCSTIAIGSTSAVLAVLLVSLSLSLMGATGAKTVGQQQASMFVGAQR